jgi:hypothetical protein
MPGYLTNRYVSYNPAQDIVDLNTSLTSSFTTSISTTNSNVSALDTRITEAEANIEDLQLQIGV